MMNTRIFDTAAALAEKRQHMLVSTTDQVGVSHIASVGSVRRISEDELALGDCYCPLTLVNLRQNPRITMVVWDVATDMGYQLIGDVEAITLLDEEDAPAFSEDPETILGSDREMLVRVNKVMDFSHASHSDSEVSDESDELLALQHPADTEQARSNWHHAYLYLGQDTHV